MFETAEVGQTIDKETYSSEAPQIRAALLQAQKELAGADFSVVLIVGGVEGGGKSEVVNLLLEWLDARGIQTHALWDPTDEERERPPLWRFWRVLPPRGRIGIFFGSWYTQPIIDRVLHGLDRPQLDQALDRIVAFEQMLTNENALIVKFWMHLSKAVQKERLKTLAADPQQRWRVTKQERKFVQHCDTFRQVDEEVLSRTSTGAAPWVIVEATDKRYRNLTVAKTLLRVLEERLKQGQSARPRFAPGPTEPPLGGVNVLNRLDMSRALDATQYEEKLQKFQGKLNRLTRRLYEKKRSLILVFEGPDAAGKGGAIRRLTAGMDARDYQVIAIGAPTDEESAHPYLWRFWRHLPRLGRVTIYDRSWYGRVLVERVEGFCPPSAWQRAYAEINAFEEQLTQFGIIVLKFWLAITPEEQLRRFKDRETTPYKQYKLTEEDWRNRDKWAAYETAACDMIEKTSTEEAPWVLVEANNKEWARIKVLKTVVRRLRQVLRS
jgi:polyphosphate:AMP phosphotransferase